MCLPLYVKCNTELTWARPAYTVNSPSTRRRSNLWEVLPSVTEAYFYVSFAWTSLSSGLSGDQYRNLGKSAARLFDVAAPGIPQKERGFARCPKGWKQFTIWYVKWQNMSSYILSFWMIIWLAVAEFSTPQAQTNVPATWTWNGKLQGKNLNPDEQPAKCPHLGSFPTWAASCPRRLSLLESFHRHLLSVPSILPSRKRANFGEERKTWVAARKRKGILVRLRSIWIVPCF